MIILYILLSLILLYIILLPAPAYVIYRSVYGLRRVLPPDDPKLKRPGVGPFMDDIKEDYLWLMKKPSSPVSVTAADGAALYGDYYEQNSPRTVLLIHGYNADPYVNLSPQAKWFYEEGWNLLIIYQRAHSKSGGRHCGMGLLEKDDVRLWAEYLAEAYPERRIMLYGISMGGSAVAYLSDSIDNPAVRCAVIDCGYVSAYNQLRRESERMHLPFKTIIPYILWLTKRGMGVDLRERTDEHLRNARLPILFIHGGSDPTVPLEEAALNYEACSGEKAMTVIEGAEHTTAFVKDREKCAEAIDTFAQRYM